jgi:mono/diheme cytochrome c family protein
VFLERARRATDAERRGYQVAMQSVLIVSLLVVEATLGLLARGPGAPLFQDARNGGGRTVLDGVYTAEQADRGKAFYVQSCAGCHAADLRGNGTAPSLVEGDFAFQWADASVGELFEQIRKLMPSDRPNSLPPQRYADIVAYILQSNQFPPGPADLPPEAAALMQIRIVAKTKP